MSALNKIARNTNNKLHNLAFKPGLLRTWSLPRGGPLGLGRHLLETLASQGAGHRAAHHVCHTYRGAQAKAAGMLLKLLTDRMYYM